jgi:hypothetical protein
MSCSCFVATEALSESPAAAPPAHEPSIGVPECSSDTELKREATSRDEAPHGASDVVRPPQRSRPPRVHEARADIASRRRGPASSNLRGGAPGRAEWIHERLRGRHRCSGFRRISRTVRGRAERRGEPGRGLARRCRSSCYAHPRSRGRAESTSRARESRRPPRLSPLSCHESDSQDFSCLCAAGASLRHRAAGRLADGDLAFAA